MEAVESANPRTKMRLWLIEHFRILPTDERYKKLSEDQIEILFCNFLSSPIDEEYKNTYRQGMSKTDVIKSMPTELFKDMGYDENDIKQISQEIAVGGRDV